MGVPPVVGGVPNPPAYPIPPSRRRGGGLVQGNKKANPLCSIYPLVTKKGFIAKIATNPQKEESI